MSPGEHVAWLSFWAAVATAVMLLAGVIYTARKGHQSTQQASAVGMTGALYERIDKLESQVAELWVARQSDAERWSEQLRKRDDHIDRLEHHIYKQLPPPPPPRDF